MAEFHGASTKQIQITNSPMSQTEYLGTRIGFGHLDFENLKLFRIALFGFRIYPFAVFSVVNLHFTWVASVVNPPPRPGDLLSLDTLVPPTGLSVAR